MLIDLHAHTAGISRCCKIAAPQMVRVAKENGMDGLVLTNHYQKNYVTDGDFDAFAKRYIEEYSYTKACGEAVGCAVFFGIEVTMERYPKVHLLIYGVDTAFVTEHPMMFDATQEELYRIVKERGGMLIQAHPYRKADHLLDVRYLDGVEISCHPLYEGTHLTVLAEVAVKAGGILTCGGDFHNDTHRPRCGIYLPDGIENSRKLGKYLTAADELRLCVQETDARESHDVVFRRGVGIIRDAGGNGV